jgi:succinyl-diaminopimelate desuccinylase
LIARGGFNINSVLDRTEIGIDIRTIASMRHGVLRDQIASYLGPGVELAPVVDAESVWTAPSHPWMREVFAICADVQGTAALIETAPYFTDASALTPALGGVPTVILGPGHAHMAHQTDEWCECARIEELLLSSPVGMAIGGVGATSTAIRSQRVSPMIQKSISVSEQHRRRTNGQ